jgi:hypothetical protein
MLKRAAVGFDLSKSERIKGAPVLRVDLDVDTDRRVPRPRSLLLGVRSSKGTPDTADVCETTSLLPEWHPLQPSRPGI